MPSPESASAITFPTPHRRPIGSGARNAASPPCGTTTSPSGFFNSEAIFARNLFGARPADAVRPVPSRMRALIARTASRGGPKSEVGEDRAHGDGGDVSRGRGRPGAQAPAVELAGARALKAPAVELAGARALKAPARSGASLRSITVYPTLRPISGATPVSAR